MNSSKTVEMHWDPITRIVGSLGIYTKIDFEARRVVECRSTSSIFRGYSVFLRGKDPRDAHQLTSRICGICGDNHATCAVYAQNMAFGVVPPPVAEWIINLGEAADIMFDHNLYQDNLVGVDYCEKTVKATNPGVWTKALNYEAAGAEFHGYKTIAEIMTALNPFEGAIYKEALQMSRLTREMFCLMEGRHAHPSTLYPGGVGTVPSIQLFDDYLARLMKYVDFLKKMIPLHDDLFDFFYDALPGYEAVGNRRVMLGCWGAFNNPDFCDYRYETMSDWGREMFVSPAVIIDGELRTNDLVEINLGIRILPGGSFYEDWIDGEKFVEHDPLGNQIDIRHPWNQVTIPKPQKRDFENKYTWVFAPRWFDRKTGEQFALDSGGGGLARLWSTALNHKLNLKYAESTGKSVKIRLPRSASFAETEYEWKIPRWNNVLERNRARTYSQGFAAALALHFVEQAQQEVYLGNLTAWTPFEVPENAISCGFHEAVRGMLSHHLVIRDGKIANYHPYPPTPWNASPRDENGVSGAFEDAITNTPLFEENDQADFKGIDIMRVIRSFDPCMPCGVHFYTGDGDKILETHHSQMFGHEE